MRIISLLGSVLLYFMLYSGWTVTACCQFESISKVNIPLRSILSFSLKNFRMQWLVMCVSCGSSIDLCWEWLLLLISHLERKEIHHSYRVGVPHTRLVSPAPFAVSGYKNKLGDRWECRVLGEEHEMRRKCIFFCVTGGTLLITVN